MLDRRSAMMQTMIDQGSSLAISNNRFSPFGALKILKSRCGLRGMRVGEGSQPGPDSLPDEQFIDALEFDLTREDSDRSTSEFGHGEVAPSLADTESIDGVEESEMGEDVVVASRRQSCTCTPTSTHHEQHSKVWM